MLEIVVAALVGVIVWTYVGFPVVLVLRAWARPRPYRSADLTPSLTVVVAAHDEEAVIGAKLANLLTLDYPTERLRVVVVSDGSTDGTETVVADHATRDGRVRLVALPRVGKSVALNRAVAATDSDIVVFSDANSMLAPDALRQLVRPFADPTVGAVAGDQRYTTPDGVGGLADAERGYWDLDRHLKVAASSAGNAISSTGALHAVRRELIDPVPDGVTDDFFLSTGAIVHGRRLVFAPDAATYEPVATTPAREFDRKVRVITRGLRSVRARATLLVPWRYGFYSVQVWSHKVLRRLVAVPLVALYAATLIGAWTSVTLASAAAVQTAFYGLAATGLVAGRGGRRLPALLRLPAYFCLVNAAALVALVRTVSGRTTVAWEPAGRTPVPRG
jgi:cellulose synthase/poly-beta-1,6-N-acetylglucosamine synthase-like glycosyltransferase